MKKIISQHWRLILVLFAMLVVFSATYYKWNKLLHTYGNYSSYVKVAEDNLDGTLLFQNLGHIEDSFEKETIYREAVKFQYWVAFWKIWTFDAFVFVSTALILLAVPKQNKI